MEEVIEQPRQPVGDVVVEAEGLADDNVERDLDQAVGLGGAGGSGADRTVEEPLPVLDVFQDEGRLHVSEEVGSGQGTAAAKVAELAEESRMEAGVEVDGEGANEGSVVPGTGGGGVVAESGEVEEAAAAGALGSRESLVDELGSPAA